VGLAIFQHCASVCVVKTAQNLVFVVAGNALIGISKEDCTVDVVRYGSDRLEQFLR